MARQRFLLTCLLRGMTILKQRPYKAKKFLLTCLLRGMTRLTVFFPRRTKFLLTCLLRGMTRNKQKHIGAEKFLLTCLLRGMTECPPPPATDCPEKFLLTCLLRGMTAIFCVFFAIMPPYTRDRLFNKYIFLFFSDKVSLPRGEPDIVF